MSDVEIAALAANEPLGRDRSEVESHLAECADCRQRLQSAREAASGEAQPGAETLHLRDMLDQAFKGAEREAQPESLKIDGYEILARVQGGGQGVVFKAIQKSTNRLVAVKVLPHEESATSQQKHRFEREVSLAASLRHPHIVTIYDSGLTSGRYFFAMEYIHGQPLDEFARGLSRDAKLELFEKLCDAMAYAHQQGIVHRDLKPGNVMVDARGGPHVLDFGLAKSAAVQVRAGEIEKPITMTSQFMGTLAYAAPEQTLGDPSLVDRRSDVYALGVMLFQMLTGRLPYELPNDLLGTFAVIRNSLPCKPSDVPGVVGIDRDLDTIVLRALAKEPARRYQSAEELAADIRRYRAGEAIAARRDSIAYIAGIKARRALRRHPALTSVVLVIVALVAARFGAEGINSLWPAPTQWFEYASGASREASAPGAFDRVRIVKITDDSARLIEDLAADAGLAGVSAEEWVSVRRLHGALMKRLAEAGVSAVVWDITFIAPTEFDEDFVAGVEALSERGIGTVVSIDTWNVPDMSRPPISPAISAAGVLWGGITINVDEMAVWKAEVVVQQKDRVAVPSLALAALVAIERPGMNFVATLYDLHHLVELHTGKARSPMMLTAEKFRTVDLSLVRPAQGTADDPFDGISAGALVGYIALPLPPQDLLDAASRSYHEVWRMSREQLAEWCDGRAVIVCDCRTQNVDHVDCYKAADGRELWGGEAHAAAIDVLLREAVSARYPIAGITGAYTLVIALAGLLGLTATHHRLPGTLKVLLLVGLAATTVSACLVAYRLTGYLCSPMALILAMVFTFSGRVWLDRLHASRLQ